MKIKFYYLALIRAKDKEFPYSIHGLWPQEGKREGHACPKNHTFDTERLRVLLPQLHEHWHSSRGEDEDFWKHEWEKHGSCTGLTEVQYFQKTLECFKKVQLKGKEWVQQRSTKIPFDLRFEIVSELDFVEM
jgi:ribonuclease I